MQNSPVFSIITATFNAESMLPHLLASLAEQSFRDFNVIIQDGGSVDNTLLVAQSFRSALPDMVINSMTDNGIYDAWNKALDNGGAHLGQWLLFLGADDRLAGADVLAKVHGSLGALPSNVSFAATEICWVVGDRIERARYYAQLPESFDNMWKHMAVPFPGLFIRKNIFAEVRFDSAFKIAGDYDFLVRTWQRLDALVALPIMTARFSLGGCSTRFSQGITHIAERFRIRKKYFPERYQLVDFLFAHVVLCTAGPKEILRRQLLRSKLGQHLLQAYKMLKKYLLHV